MFFWQKHENGEVTTRVAEVTIQAIAGIPGCFDAHYLSFSKATLAATSPDKNMEPKVGPILGKP